MCLVDLDVIRRAQGRASGATVHRVNELSHAYKLLGDLVLKHNGCAAPDDDDCRELERYRRSLHCFAATGVLKDPKDFKLDSYT